MNALETVTVLNRQGQSVSLASFWADTPVVLVFVRHFG